MQLSNLSAFDKVYVRTDREIKRASKQIQLPLLMKEIFNRNVHKKQMQMINDPSNTTTTDYSRYQKICNYLQKNVPVILPSSRFLLFWNILIYLIIIINFIQMPIDLLILQNVKVVRKEQEIYDIFNGIMLAMLFIDLFLIRFRIAFYYHEILVSKYEAILTNYLSKAFLMDLFAVLGYLIDVLNRGTDSYTKILFLFKIYTIFKLNKQLQIRLMFHKYSLAFSKFLRMVAFIFCITNLNACIYFAIDFYHYTDLGFYYENGYLWLNGSSTTQQMDLIQTFDWQVWYIYALYWSVQTSATVGYGNMTPRNPYEVFFCNVVMLLTVGIFIIYANKIIQIIQQLQENREIQQDVLLNMNLYTRMNPMNKEMKKKVQFFAESYGKLQSEDIQKITQEVLSESLYTSFALELKSQMFSNMRILTEITQNKAGFKNKFSKQVISFMKTNFFSTNDTIVQKYSKDSFKLYVIACGKISVFNDTTDYYKDYAKYEYIGQDYFFFGGVIPGKMFSKTFTKVFYFQKQDFFNILKKYPEQNQKLKEKIEEVKVNKKEAKMFDISCYYCDEYHLTQNCPVCQFWRNEVPTKDESPPEKKHSENERAQNIRKKIKSFKIINKFKYQPMNIQSIHNSRHYYVNYNL